MNTSRYSRFLYPGALIAVLALGLAMRLMQLGSVQHFTTDQGRDYIIIMNWLLDGKWPLLGPYRAVGGDYAIGPGYYYTIAPFLGLSGFHPAAGAAMISVVGLLAACLAGLWVRRATGSRLAALSVVMLMAFSAYTVDRDRMLWNPHLMPFATVALACLIEGLRRRPVPCLTLTLMLFAILPQWHSTGILMILAAGPVLAVAVARDWGLFRQTQRRIWWIWGGMLAAVVLLLYVPPIIYELKPGPGNLRYYLAKTMLPAKPVTVSPAERVTMGTQRLVDATTREAFGWAWPKHKHVQQRLLAALLVAGAFLGVYGQAWRRERWRDVNLSPIFLVLLTGGYWMLLILKPKGVLDYFLYPVLAAPMLLGAWTAGRLLTQDGHDRRARLARGTGLALVLGSLALSLAQLPAAWNIHYGRSYYGRALAHNRKIVKKIIKDAGKQPFSVMLVQNPPGKFLAGHFHALLRISGRAAQNYQHFDSRTIPKNELGKRLYVIVNGKKMKKSPKVCDFPGTLTRPMKMHDALIYLIEVDHLPRDLQGVTFPNQGTEWSALLTGSAK